MWRGRDRRRWRGGRCGWSSVGRGGAAGGTLRGEWSRLGIRRAEVRGAADSREEWEAREEWENAVGENCNVMYD